MELFSVGVTLRVSAPIRRLTMALKDVMAGITATAATAAGGEAAERARTAIEANKRKSLELDALNRANASIKPRLYELKTTLDAANLRASIQDFLGDAHRTVRHGGESVQCRTFYELRFIQPAELALTMEPSRRSGTVTVAHPVATQLVVLIARNGRTEKEDTFAMSFDEMTPENIDATLGFAMKFAAGSQ